MYYNMVNVESSSMPVSSDWSNNNNYTFLLLCPAKKVCKWMSEANPVTVCPVTGIVSSYKMNDE